MKCRALLIENPLINLFLGSSEFPVLPFLACFCLGVLVFGVTEAEFIVPIPLFLMPA